MDGIRPYHVPATLPGSGGEGSLLSPAQARELFQFSFEREGKQKQGHTAGNESLDSNSRIHRLLCPSARLTCALPVSSVPCQALCTYVRGRKVEGFPDGEALTVFPEQHPDRVRRKRDGGTHSAPSGYFKHKDILFTCRLIAR